MRHSFILAALKGENSLFRYIGSIVIILIAAMVLGAIPATVLFAYSDDPAAAMAMDFETAHIHPAIGLALVLLPFVFGLLGIWFSLRYLHERPFYSLANYENKINWRKVMMGAAIWLVLTLIFEIVHYIQYPDIYEWNFNAQKFFPVLIVTLLLIPLQIAFEEFLFRGYLMQGLGIAFRYPIIALILTSVVFGAMHLANPEIGEYGDWLIWSYVQIGLVFGLVTLMDEGIELALGLHAMNNIYASVLVTFPSSALATPALFTISEFDAEASFIYGTISEVLFVLICAGLYKWKDWRKLFDKVVLRKDIIENEGRLEEDDYTLKDLGL